MLGCSANVSSNFVAGELITRSFSPSMLLIFLAMASSWAWASAVLDGNPRKNAPLVR